MKKHLLVFVVLLMFSSGLLMVNVPVKAQEPYVKVYVDQPLGYIPGEPVDTIFTVDVIIEVSGITDPYTEGIVGWGIYVQVNPDVLNFIRVKGASGGYFLWEFADWEYLPYPSLLSIIDSETGFGDIAEVISPTPSYGADDAYSGLKLVTLEFTSKSETAISKIDLFNVEYQTPDGMWHDVDEVIDGQYNEYIPHDVWVTSISFYHITVHGIITVNTTYNGLDVNLIYILAWLYNTGYEDARFEVTFTYTIANVSTTIGVDFVDVPTGGTGTATVSLNTSDFPVGYLPITVEATKVLVEATEVLDEEINFDNSMTTTLWIKQVGDAQGDPSDPDPLLGDGDVDRYDVGAVSMAYGSHYGEPRYNVEADFDRDGDVDRYDAGYLAQNYGIILPPYEPL